MQIQLNGEAKTLPGPHTVAQLLDELGFNGRRLAVEVNGEIVPRSAYPSHALAPGDRVEIVRAIGGGATWMN